MLFLLPQVGFAAIGWRIGLLKARRDAIDGELARLKVARRGGPRGRSDRGRSGRSEGDSRSEANKV
jgi:hypothetical protein